MMWSNDAAKNAHNGTSNGHDSHSDVEKSLQLSARTLHVSNRDMSPISSAKIKDNVEDHANSDTRQYQQQPVQQKNNTAFRRFRKQCGRIVNNRNVQIFIVLLIGVNALLMGVATFDFVDNDPDMSSKFEIIDMVFLIAFTVELAMQFIYLGWRLVLDGWLLFDLIIIFTSWTFAEAQIIRAFRIFRALRLITRVKVMKNLVSALFSVIPRMFAISLLLFLVTYIFGVMCTQLFKDSYERGITSADYFGRLDETFFTLFQIMTLDNWAEITRELMTVYTVAWIPLIAFVIISGFVVVNLIIAVICDAISALHDTDKAKIHGSFSVVNDQYKTDDGDVVSVGDEAATEDNIETQFVDEVKQRLTILENKTEELTRLQSETLQALYKLSRINVGS